MDEVIMASSGRLRDLMALMRNITLRAYDQKDPSAVLNEHAVAQEIERYQRDYRTALFNDDIPWLRQVAATRQLRADNEKFIPRAAKLLDTAFVLTYQNGEPWVDVNAAIRKQVEPPP
jgi:hypothetical protein